MNRHHCSVVAICVALLVTGCGPPSAAPSADEKRQTGSHAVSEQGQQSSTCPHVLNGDWAGLMGTWRCQTELEPGVRGIARCDVCRILNEQFLQCLLTVTDDRGMGMCLSLVVFRDNSTRQFRCWGLVTTGEHMEGSVVRGGERGWVLSFSVVRPDQVAGTATHSWTLVDQDTLIWEAKDRKWTNGTRSSDLRLTLKRDRDSTEDIPRDKLGETVKPASSWTRSNSSPMPMRPCDSVPTVKGAKDERKVPHDRRSSYDRCARQSDGLGQR
jgi:hypothetical protein